MWSIRITVRLRPANSSCVRAEQESVVVRPRSKEEVRFRVDRIYDCDTSQRDVFQGEGLPLIERVLEGKNALLLAYGQTGSGKTHTILGPEGTTSEDRGLVPRAVEQLYEVAARRRRAGSPGEVRLSFVEVYNDSVVDLLGDGKTELQVSETTAGVRVAGLSTAAASSTAEALELLYEAEVARAVGSHSMNAASSRSHLIVTAHVAFGACRSKLELVDLAGSERVKSTAASRAQTAREASYINKSLSFLEQVVIALADKRDHVPYRSSKLTHLLKESLGGARATLVACLWPDPAHVDQTVATLRFAARMGRISREEEEEDGGNAAAAAAQHLAAAKMRREIDALREELAARDLLTSPPTYSYARLGDEEHKRAMADATAYLADPDCVPPVATVAQVRAVFAALREAAVAPRSSSENRVSLAKAAASQGNNNKKDYDFDEVELAACKRSVRSSRARAQQAASDVNNAKRAIDVLVARLSSEENEEAKEVVSRRLESVKAEYRTAYRDLTAARADVERFAARQKDLRRTRRK
ncbi:hypothetical protein CTAYLR_000119 [Chrysophaeum taylorii]|uniref:Kinesin-like protein n=1 Tax=Chrysophaeum taylorii TaxID=2483200 RepID=A0AAD7XQV2_9STRA|nr:hypothetical protein CTAYLR_000119 [Chrysophaeum taylorii]